jgi:glycosyltransferase involved in cell wall biosynthesis
MLAPTPFFSDRGCHIRILNSYLNLKNNKNDVKIITYPIGRNILNIKPKRITKIWGYKKTAPGFSIYKPFLDLIMILSASKELFNEEYDYVYAHLHEGALIGILLKPFFSKKVVFDCQGSLVGELTSNKTIKEKSLTSKIIYQIEKFIVKHSDEIITSTEGLKEFIETNFKVSNVKVVKDIPDKSLFNPRVKPAKLKLPKNKKIVVYLGGLQLYKGIDYLIKAIQHTDKRFHFLIMGYPEEEAKQLAKQLNVKDRITFTGRIPYEKAPNYLKLGDIAISPKTLESGEANAKIYNYLAMNLPVVCFDIKENKEILGKHGIYAKHKDVKDLANKINGWRR